MKLYTIFDMDAEKCGPIFTAVNDAVCMRLIFSQHKDIPEHISSRMQVLRVGEMDVSNGSLCDCSPVALLTVKEIVHSFLSSLEVKDVNLDDSQH